MASGGHMHNLTTLIKRYVLPVAGLVSVWATKSRPLSSGCLCLRHVA